MHPLLPSYLLVLPALWNLALAEKSSTQKCYTVLGRTSLSQVLTKTKTVHNTVTKTIIRNIHPHTTITPDPTTSTVSETEIYTATDNEPQQTDTAYTTLTKSFSTTTTLDVVTETSSTTITTSTTYTPTSTIPPNPNFTGVLDTFPGTGQSSVTKKKKRRVNVLRSRISRSMKAKLSFSVDSQRYPQKVNCVDEVYHTRTSRITHMRTGVITRTATTPTITTHVTSTSTTTSTSIPDKATTTITDTTSTTSTATESPTTTTTTTYTDVSTTTILPSATIFAECDPLTSRNYAGSLRGLPFSDLIFDQATGPVSTTSSSPHDCCAQCVSQGAACAVSAWLESRQECDMAIYREGSVSSPSDWFYAAEDFHDPPPPPDSEFILSNGPQNYYTDD